MRTAVWLETNAVVPVRRWARFSRAMRDVLDAEGRDDVLHDDTGRPAIEWPDGTGDHFINGTEFDEHLYFQGKSQ